MSESVYRQFLKNIFIHVLYLFHPFYVLRESAHVYANTRQMLHFVMMKGIDKNCWRHVYVVPYGVYVPTIYDVMCRPVLSCVDVYDSKIFVYESYHVYTVHEQEFKEAKEFLL